MARPVTKYYTKEQLETAMRHSKSIRSMARYLRCSTIHLKGFLKMYTDELTGKTFYEMMKNQSGKGIAKFLKNKKKNPDLKQIVTEGTGWEPFTPEKIKKHLIIECYLREQCYRCGFEERRVLDQKVPLLLSFKDGYRNNYLLDNLELICYNCYFLTIGNVFNPDQIRWVEEYSTPKAKAYDWEIERIPEDPKTEWQLSEDQLENMRQLGLL